MKILQDVVKKMQIKDHGRYLVLGLPEELAGLTDALPGTVKTEPNGESDCIIVFAKDPDTAKQRVDDSIPTLKQDGLFWFCYPKKSSRKYSCEINRDNTHEYFDPHGFKAVRQISLNEDWSALRFRDKELVK
ncbi:MAG: hypothetical protein ACLFR1_03905 [Spirochaetia bacterium]